jgi:hypothetical protein
MMENSSFGNKNPSPATVLGHTDAQVRVLGARAFAHLPEPLAKSPHCLEGVTSYSHILAPDVSDVGLRRWHSSITSTDDPAELVREPMGATALPVRIYSSTGTDHVFGLKRLE